MDSQISRRRFTLLSLGIGASWPSLADAAPRLPVLGFSERRAFAYAERYCSGGNACPSGEYPLDCTHFICHCLAAGGARIPGRGANCKSGLCIRVVELAAFLHNATGQYSNVKRLSSYKSAGYGDICILKQENRKTHAMLLATRPVGGRRPGAKVFAHTNHHCGDFAEFDVTSANYYRIGVRDGRISVAVYREPRKGQREKIPGVKVSLSNGDSTKTDSRGVAKFYNLPYGNYTASAMNRKASGVLDDSLLQLDIVVN